MATFRDLLPEVLLDVPGCSDPLAEREIRNATIRFCEQSCVLKRHVAAVAIVALKSRYPVSVPANYALNTLLWVRIASGSPIKAMSEDFLDLVWGDDAKWSCHFHGCGTRGGDWRDYEQARPCAYLMEREGAEDFIRLVGIPTDPIIAGLSYRMTLKPLRTATDIDDFVFEDYYRTIAKGALAALLRIPKKTWTDTARGIALEEEFLEECWQAKGESLKDFTRDDQVVSRTRAYV